MQVINDLKQYQLKIVLFLKEYKESPHNWVLETTVNEKTSSITEVIKNCSVYFKVGSVSTSNFNYQKTTFLGTRYSMAVL